MLVPEDNGIQSLVLLRQEFRAECTNGPWFRQITFFCVNLLIGSGRPEQINKNGDLGRFYGVWG